MSKSKGNSKRRPYDLSGVNVIEAVTEHVSKHGKIQGSKKEKKFIRAICCHHTYTKKGKKKKAWLDKRGNNECQCPICKGVMQMGFYKDHEYDKVADQFRKVINQEKLIAAATGADADTLRRVCETALYVEGNRNLYFDLRKVGQKQEDLGKKKKKKKTGQDSTFGAWHTTRR